jgi:hypothetical protein
LDHRLIEALMDPRRAPVERPAQTFFPGGAPVPEIKVLSLRNRGYTVRADVVVPPGGAEGVLIAMGTVLGGWSLHLLGGRLRYVHNFLGASIDVIEGAEVVGRGSRRLSYTFSPSSGGPGQPAGIGRLLVDGYQVAEGRIERVPFSRYNLTGGGLTCGWEQGPAVGPGYEAPFPFTGQLIRVEVTADPPAGAGSDPTRQAFSDLDAILAEQ